MTDQPDAQQRRQLTQQIADALHETKHSPIRTIARLVYHLGEERALALLNEALKVEAEGGLLTADGQQRRSVGGAFFKLAKDSITPRERGSIFGPASPEARDKRKQAAKAKQQPPDWDTLQPLAEQLLAHPSAGKADKVKLTLIGRPGQIIEKKTAVLATMESGNAPSLPKGLPPPPTDPTRYLVFIAQKQWKKVKHSLEDDPADRLIVEGYPVFDKRLGQRGALTVYAQSVTTTALQRAKWAAQKSDTPSP